MRKKKIISIVVALFLIVSTAVIAANKPVKTKANKMPDNVHAIIKKSCFGCHNTNSHNEDAKEDLDFTKLEGLSKMQKIGAYKDIVDVVEENEMPPEKFVQKHADKKLTAAEKKTLIEWAKKEANALMKAKK